MAPTVAATSGGAWANWAGNQRATPAAGRRPATVDELLADIRAAAEAGRRIRAVGSGHSFSGVARPDGVVIDLSRLAVPTAIDRAGRLATVPAGMTLRTLNDTLAANGLALPNLGDIDAQTVAGAISTGTHGTGARHGNLATVVAALTIVTAAGEVLRCSPTTRPDVFAAARIGLGALGVLTEVTLRCVDAFVLHARETPAAMADVLAGLDDHLAGNEHVEFYWFPYTDRAQLKRNNTAPADDRPLPRWRGWLDDEFLANTAFAGLCRLGRAVPAAVPLINAASARALTARSYTARSDHVFCTPRRVRFVEMEYGLPRAALPTALSALRGIVDRLPFKVQFPVEIRFTAADDIWLSHSHGRESAYVAIHQYAGAPYERYFRAFEAVCEGLGGRPHWGKLHYRDAGSLRPAYPRFDDFLAVRDELDPGRVFANAYTDRVLGP